jgi:pSer/pThr/pTyr-binding forkhead associated (FHA) protein
MAISGQEAVPAYQILGRLFSVALDDSYILPNLSEIILGRRDAASQNYPDIDLGNQGQASASVSRRHARITIQDRQLFIEDLNSRNLTQLNGQKLEPEKRYALKNGDELRLGTVVLVYISI